MEQEHQLGDFHEEIPSMEGYDKPIKKARNILFIIAALHVVSLAFVVGDLEGLALYITIGLTLVISGIFLALGLWTKSKPHTAIMIGLILYVSLLLLDAIVEPESIIRGIILKVAIIILMATALGNAKEVQQWLDLAKKNKQAN